MSRVSLFGRIGWAKLEADSAEASANTINRESQAIDNQKLTYQIDNRTVILDLTSKHATAFKRVIESSIDDDALIYMDVDSTTNEIRDLDAPYPNYVLNVEPKSPAESNRVELYSRNCILRRSNPRYASILSVLLQSLEAESNLKKRIWVVSKRSPQQDSLGKTVFEIIDALGETKHPPEPASPEPAEFNESELNPISLAKCNELYNYLKSFDTPLNAPSTSKGTIPFKLVEHGCEARAHEACRLILSKGIRPIKIWAFCGEQSFTVSTMNHPDCQVEWSFHVVVAVQTVSGVRILDPSIADYPISIREFRTRFDNQEMHIEVTGPEVYLFTQNRSLFKSDYLYAETRQFLNGLNRGLELLMAFFPSPPYQHCSTKQPHKAKKLDLART